jgi:WD repeat-containing protein 19
LLFSARHTSGKTPTRGKLTKALVAILFLRPFVVVDRSFSMILQWDHVGESLAVLQQGNGEVPIWDSTSRSVNMLDTKLKDPTFLKWSRKGPQLAVGSAKGNLLIYRKDNRKLIPVAGKHSNRRITCGAWNAENQLALGGQDKHMTLSNAEGDTLMQKEVSHEPLDVQFAGSLTTSRRSKSASSRSEGKSSGGGSGVTSLGDLRSTISMNLGGKTLRLLNMVRLAGSDTSPTPPPPSNQHLP